jgi:hypothetical protein
MVRDVLRAEALLVLALGVVETPSPIPGFMGPVAPLPIFLRVFGCSLVPVEWGRGARAFMAVVVSRTLAEGLRQGLIPGTESRIVGG